MSRGTVQGGSAGHDRGALVMPRNGTNGPWYNGVCTTLKVKHWGFRDGGQHEWAPGSARGDPGEAHQGQSGPLVQTPRPPGYWF